MAAFIEPVIGILADTWRRRALLLAGGAAFVAATVLTAGSYSFGLVLFSFVLFSPASGAFVNISQITLMDLQPARREQNMARWTLAGSIGAAAGPLLLAGASRVGLGWRGAFAAGAVLGAILLARAWRSHLPPAPADDSSARRRAFREGIREGVRETWRALRRGAVLRWLVLLSFADLMLDVLFGFLALYFVDVGGAPAGTAALIVLGWTLCGLMGDFLMIPLLERVSGLTWLRVSAALMLAAFPAFLLAGPLLAKVILLGVVALLKSGWYAVPEARLYAALPGKSGTVMAARSLVGLVDSFIPLGLGAVAQAAGLGFTMWLLLAGPVALIVGLPRLPQAGLAPMPDDR